LGVDAGFGSSKFGIVIMQLFDNRIHVIFAEEYERLSFADMIDGIWGLGHNKCHATNIMVDAANPEIIEVLKREFGESTDWNYIHERIAFFKKFSTYVENIMKISPCSLSTEGRKMLQHAKYL
jgi:hypothetical protein